jgi:hypothetical protein
LGLNQTHLTTLLPLPNKKKCFHISRKAFEKEL